MMVLSEIEAEIETMAIAMWQAESLRCLGRRRLISWDEEGLGVRSKWLDLSRAACAAQDGRFQHVRHLKRGTTYRVLGEGEVQISQEDAGLDTPHARILEEGDSLVVYRCDQTGKLWLRFPDEFTGDRFERVIKE